MVLSTLRSLLASYWPHLGLLLGLALAAAWKLRLLKKLGLQLAGLGALFFLAAVVTAGNPVLLLLANMFWVSGSLVDHCITSSPPWLVCAGLVLMLGLQRTRLVWGLVTSLQCCGAGRRAAAWILATVLTAELLNMVQLAAVTRVKCHVVSCDVQVPVVWRLYPYIPVLRSLARTRSDSELRQMARCECGGKGE